MSLTINISCSRQFRRLHLSQLSHVKCCENAEKTQKLVKMHNTQIPPTNLLFDQKEDLEPSTQTAVADDRRFKWNNLEAALMLFSCSFRSELENFSPPLVTSSFTNKQIQSPKRSSLKYFCSQKCKLSKKRQRTMTPNCKTKNTEREKCS